MSDIGISYNATTEPSAVGAKFSLSFSGTTLRAGVAQINNFIISLTPSGNISEAILSGVAWPIAQALGAALPSLARNLIDGYSFSVMSISPSRYTLEGDEITVSPGDLSLSNYGDMLMVQGNLDVK